MYIFSLFVKKEEEKDQCMISIMLADAKERPEQWNVTVIAASEKPGQDGGDRGKRETDALVCWEENATEISRKGEKVAPCSAPRVRGA